MKRHTPCMGVSMMACQPPIFSGWPARKRTLSQSNQPPDCEYSVVSRTMPGVNWSFVRGTAVYPRRFKLLEQRLKPWAVVGAEALLPLFEDALDAVVLVGREVEIAVSDALGEVPRGLLDGALADTLHAVVDLLLLLGRQFNAVLQAPPHADLVDRGALHSHQHVQVQPLHMV